MNLFHDSLFRTGFGAHSVAALAVVVIPLSLDGLHVH